MSLDEKPVTITVPEEIFEGARAQFERDGYLLEQAVREDPRTAYQELGSCLIKTALTQATREINEPEALLHKADQVLDEMVPELDAAPREVLVEVTKKPSLLRHIIRADKRQRVVTALHFRVPAL